MKKSMMMFCRRLLSLLLCAAMVLPVISEFVFAIAAAQVSGESGVMTESELNQINNLYPGGTKSNTMEYDCGNGVSRGGEKSYLTVVTNTTDSHFNTFKMNLENAGFVEMASRTVASNTITENVFASFRSPDGNYKLYTYHFPGYGETRIIVDTQTDTVEGFVYEPQEGVVVSPKLVMYGLSMSPNGYGYSEKVNPNQLNRRNCGAMAVIRMPDNSLLIHDGGDVQQWNDEACDDFVDFCRELTGTKPGEKMIINTWFLSHAHIDHYQGFQRLMNMKHDQFDLKNIMYNIDNERFGTACDITEVMNLLSDLYPDVRYYKPHTGEIIDVAGVKLDIVYSLEDRYVPDSNGDLITDTENQGGTYRDFMYKSDGNSDFNDTSTVLRVTFSNGISSLLYGDMNLADQMLRTAYAPSVLKTDIMMIPHHGHNTHKELVDYADSKVYLYTQHKGAVYGPDNDVTTLDMYGTYRESVRDKFITMFKDKGMYVPAGTEEVDFDIFWAGNETVSIDIVALGRVMTNASTEPYYTTQPAPTFEYTGWGVMDLSSEEAEPDMLLSMVNQETLAEQVLSTKTNRFELVASGELVDNKRYVIMHKSSGFVMAYDPVAVTPGRPNQATSLLPASQAELDSDVRDVYYVHTNNHMYIDHSYRNRVIWILNQESNDRTALEKSTWKDPLFGGTAYGEVWLSKGVKDEYDENGNHTASRNGNYWYSVYGQDNSSPVTQYRFLDPRYCDEQWVKTSAPTGDDATQPKRRYLIEDLGNGDFLVYWRSASGATASFLTCDADGNWGVVKYTDDTTDYYPSVPKAGAAELERLKLHLYVYTPFSKDTDVKKVVFSGYRTYNVKRDTSAAQLLSYIQENIVLKDTSRWNMHVPCSGTTPKVGYYYLKFNKEFDSSGESNNQYTVSVLYRNDNHIDAEITTLTVNVGYEVDENGDLVQCVHEIHDTNGFCVRCGMAVSHSYQGVAYKPDCTTEGYTHYTCSVCGHSYKDDLVAPMGHEYQENVTPPTCMTEGYTVFTCVRCGYSKVGAQVSATGHHWSEASCTEAKRCSDCGTISGAPLGHTYNAVVTVPTCTAGGYTTYTCTACGHEYTGNATSALGHSYKDEVVTAGCLNDGFTLHTCIRCNDSYKDGFQNATGHSWTEATCTEPATCTACGLVRGEAQGHMYDAVVTEPTCTAGGYTTYTCSICGYSETGDEKNPLGHSYVDEIVKAGCLSDGYTIHTCIHCGHSYKDAFQYAQGHFWVEASCTEPTRCTACGLTRGEALGHSYDGGSCTVCGATNPDAVVNPDIAIDHPSLSFESEILYNFYFTAGDLTDVVEMGLITFSTRQTEGTVATAEKVYPGYASVGGGMYMVQTEGVSAKNLGDAVYVKIYAKLRDGSYVYTDMVGYNAAAYAKSILKNSSNAYMKQLVVAMMNYGTEAQLYFGHNTSSPMNSFLTDAQKALVQEYNSTMVSGVVSVDSTKAGSLVYNGSSFAKRAPSVSFDGAFSINYYFTTANVPDGEVKLYYWTLEDYNAATQLSPRNATGSMSMTNISGNQYWGQVSGIAAKELDETVFVLGVYAYNGTTYTTGVLNYHIGKYCTTLAAKDTSEQQELAKATAVYGYYAKEYFANL